MTIGQRKIRPGWLMATGGTVLGLAIAGTVLFSTALAVHDSPFPFELDGNVKQDSARDDWQNVFGITAIPPQTGTPTATGASVFIHDTPMGSPAKETQYDAGKDVLDTNQWTRKDVTKVVPDKDNILDAFAKQYMVDTDGNPNTAAHRVIYFGADRYANNGDATMSFWFFQQHLDLTGTNGFSPKHTARSLTGHGDILVQVDFLNGGGESRLRVFEWVGSGGSDGPLDLLRNPADVNGATVCLNDDTACATTNNVGGVNTYWPYVPKAGPINKFPAESLFEGGIDITALAGDLCFNSFLASTRSSQQTTSDLKDLALGDFNTCGHIDLVRKVCQADSTLHSPSFDYTSNSYQTKHEITIRNDGLGGDVFDIGVRDDSVGTHASCNIIAINGGVGNPSIPTGGIEIPDKDTFIKVADRLAAGEANQMSVTLLCQADVNSFHNAASIRAGQQPGGTSLTDSYAESDTTNDVKPQCTATFNPSLTVTKSCNDVTLDSTNGFKPKVCSTITIANNDTSQRLYVTEFKDTHMDTTSKDLLSFIPTATVNGTTKHVLEPSGHTNSSVTVIAPDTCYTPTAPDNNQTDPDQVTYTDQASAKTEGQAAGTADDASDSVNCALCPIGIDGPAH